MTTCLPRVVDLGRGDRVHISWPVTGVEAGNIANASLDGGPSVPLNLATDLKTAIGYFAGPNFQTPGAAVVVAHSAYVTVQIITSTETITFDGGFIRLVP